MDIINPSILLKKYHKTNKINGLEYVDLGLPSGTLWATRNLGADEPQERGLFFNWGNTHGRDITCLKTKEKVFSNREYEEVWPNVRAYYEDGKLILSKESDAAYQMTDGHFRMPTIAELNELADNCQYKFTQVSGKFCTMVTGPNGNSIILPLDGGIADGGVFAYGNECIIWSNSSFDEFDANRLSVTKHSIYTGNDRKFFGIHIRPVVNK